LSEKRAQAVYDALINEGVDKSQLELIGHGGTPNMFDKDSLNRVVIME
jgi:OmpA-OmpF porin, OOP family